MVDARMLKKRPMPGSFLAVTLIGLISSSPCIVSAGTGSYAFVSLRRPATAQETCWGGLEGSGVGGPEALRANPAGLAEAAPPCVTLAHQSWLSDLQQQWSGWKGPLGKSGSVALELAATHAGTLDAFDEDGTPLGTFRPVEGFAGVGMGLRVSEGTRLGCSLHALYMGAAADHLTAYSASFGLESTIQGGCIGIALRDIGPDPRGEQGTFRLPSTAVLGLSGPIRHLGVLSLTGGLDRDRSLSLSGGARWTPANAFAFLAGFSYRTENVDHAILPAAGIEINMGSVGVGYAYAPSADAPPTHHLSLRLSGAAHERRTGDASHPPSPTNWIVWGGMHRSQSGAQAEVRALETQGVSGAAIVPGNDGSFRVQIAVHLGEKEAIELARRLHAEAVPE